MLRLNRAGSMQTNSPHLERVKSILNPSEGCDVTQMVVRQLAVRHARVRFPARHPREFFPTELTSDEEKERNHGELRRINVLYECNGMTVCTRKYQTKQKSGIMATNL